VEELTLERIQDLDLVRNLPTQFQEYIPGTNVRVHTIGRKHFATEIESDAVDYRYAARFGSSISVRPCALPSKIASRCVELARAFGLRFAGIDLKRTAQGRYYCFEVNPSPAYSYYEEQTGQPIAEALVDYLAVGD
jgi:glutathione synthase/RimK-type ligase-like ATP-grasp enzyme